MKFINKHTIVAALFGMTMALVCVLAVQSYGRAGASEVRAVSETRTVVAADIPAAGAPATCPSMASKSMGQSTAAAPASLQWQAPDGWKDAGTKGMRLANFTAGPAGEAECYVTVLAGTGGGVAKNVNRWRAQLGLPDASEADIAALPKITMLGGEGVLVDVEGTYGGSSDGVHAGAETLESYRLLGVIAQRPDEAVFVKMTGPANVVAGERDKFVAFAGSLREAPVPAGATAADAKPAEASAPAGAAGEHECCEQEH